LVARFLKYVEIMTKITSLFAFAMTLSYLFYIGVPINFRLTLIFFIGMFVFDLTTTAINNYIDTKTNDQQLQFKRNTAKAIIFILFGISTAFGLYLAYLTDMVVLALGAICFLFGVFYTYGPIPISRMPLGEVFSGFFYGVMIPFILLYINMPKGYYLTVSFSLESILVELQNMPLLSFLLLAIAPFCTTADIMLANNICDVERDVAVKRYTLPYYLGKKRSLRLFAGLYYAIYVSIIVMVAVKILSPISLLTLLTIFPVQSNIRTFYNKQEKEETFVTAIKNFIIIMGAHSVFIFVSRWFAFW